MSHRERARCERLDDAIAALLPALERHSNADATDLARLRSEWRPVLEEPLPEQGVGADAVLDLLENVIINNGIRIGASGFCGWITTAPTTIPAAAQLVGSIAATQRWWVHPGNFLEVQALDWLASLIGLAPDSGGAFTSGGSVANLLALGAARQHAGERLGIDIALDGVSALPEPRIYASDQVHHVALRAAGTLGFGRRALRRVPTNRKMRIDLSTLEAWIDEDIAAGHTPVAVIATGGDVNTGTVDPIPEMRTIAHDRGIWLHVDGAYGGFGVLDDRVSPLFGDLSLVDSIAIDPHKWLAIPVGCGAVFARDAKLIDRAFALEPADYVPHVRRTDEDPGSCFDELGFGAPDRGLDHSAPSRGLVVWAALKEIGANGMRARVSRHLDCARRVAERVRADDNLELLCEPVLSICCFRFHPPHIRDTATLERLNADILVGIRARGRSIPSGTRVNGKTAIRPCFIGARNALADADALVDEVLAVGQGLIESSCP